TGGGSFPERPPSPSPATPTHSPTVDQSSEQEISPISLDVVLTLSQSKTRARAAKIIYKRLKKQQSYSSLDFTDVAILAVGREGISRIGSVNATPELGVGLNGIGGGEDCLGGEGIGSVEGCGSTTGDGRGGETSCG
nr:hypothetical protein [Tanacetum cinerariifolium]